MIFGLSMRLYFLKRAGGYKGDKDGYKIPAGTDIFISVSTAFIFPFLIVLISTCRNFCKCNA